MMKNKPTNKAFNIRQSLQSVLLLAMLAVVIGFYCYGGDSYFSLQAIKQLQLDLQQQQGLTIAVIFFLTYLFMTAFSLPAAGLLTLLAGSLFGFWTALLLASFASTLGATLAFLMARFVIGDRIRERFSKQLPRFNEGFAQEGAFYLFALRLVPLFPFFMVNLLMALVPIKTWTFYWVSQLGMLVGTAVYVYAGTQLGQIEQLADILSAPLLLAFALLGLMPIASKKLLAFYRRQQQRTQKQAVSDET